MCLLVAQLILVIQKLVGNLNRGCLKNRDSLCFILYHLIKFLCRQISGSNIIISQPFSLKRIKDSNYENF
jgi:hypothetical protein